jgi:hypothetical protein
VPHDRNEVGHQVERHGQIRDEDSKHELRASGNARIAQQALAQDDALGDEPRDVARAAATAYEEQDRDQEEPDRSRRAEVDREPEPGTQAATARRSSSNSAI